MATTGTAVTYADLASRLEGDDKVAAGIIELTRRTNRVLDDMMVVEGNLLTGHRTTIRTGLPTATWRLLNYGVQPSKSLTSQITDETGMLEAYAEVDKDLADLNNNDSAWRLSEDQAFLESMNQEMTRVLFYGDHGSNPAEFNGMDVRYDTLTATPYALNDSRRNVVNAYSSASGSDQTSMWLVVWGPNTVHGIYPKGSRAGGWMRQDLGEVTLYDTQSPQGRYQGYRTHYQWKLGLTVRDWRYVVRIANIDTSALTSSAVDLFDAMTTAYYRIPTLEMGMPVFYCNSVVQEFLHKQAVDTTLRANAALRLSDVGGKPVLNYLGIPIKRCDGILNTESVVTT